MSDPKIEPNDAYKVDRVKYLSYFKEPYFGNSKKHSNIWIIDKYDYIDVYYSILHFFDNGYKLNMHSYNKFIDLIQIGVITKEPELKIGDEFTVDYDAYMKHNGRGILVIAGKPETIKVTGLSGGYINFANQQFTTKSLYKEIDLGIYLKINTQKQVVTSGLYCGGTCGVQPQVRYYGPMKSFNFCPKCRKEIV